MTPGCGGTPTCRRRCCGSGRPSRCCSSRACRRRIAATGRARPGRGPLRRRPSHDPIPAADARRCSGSSSRTSSTSTSSTRSRSRCRRTRSTPWGSRTAQVQVLLLVATAVAVVGGLLYGFLCQRVTIRTATLVALGNWVLVFAPGARRPRSEDLHGRRRPRRDRPRRDQGDGAPRPRRPRPEGADDGVLRLLHARRRGGIRPRARSSGPRRSRSSRTGALRATARASAFSSSFSPSRSRRSCKVRFPESESAGAP